MRTIERDIVSAHLYSSDGKLFVARDNGAPGTVYAGTWKIPGGGVEEGETWIQTFDREVLEETGIDTSALPKELVDDSMTGESEKTLKKTGETVLVKMKFIVYRTTLNTLAEQIAITLDPAEFDEYRWVTIPELKTLKLSPPSVELFTRLGYL